VSRDDAVEGLDVLEGATHQRRVGHADAVVGEDPHAGRGIGHCAQLGQCRAGQAASDRTDRGHVAVAGGAPEVEDLLDDTGGVGDGVGVGHRVDGGESAQGCGGGAGRDGLGVLAAGLAQVGVQVDPARQRDEAARVQDVGAAQAGAEAGDDPVLDEQIGRLTAEQGRAADQPAHDAPPASSR
jgi:hypothetical protein